MLVYFTPIIGGWLTDHFITKRHAITIGGIIMAIGNFVLFSMNTKNWTIFRIRIISYW